jgi:hypothetical protein
MKTRRKQRFFLIFLRVFVVDFHSLSGIAHRAVNRPSGESPYPGHARIELINGL